MRGVFQEELDQINDQLVQLCGLSSEALQRATDALLTADLSLAQQVISDDQFIDALRRDLDNRAVDVLARQQPVATDLRQMVTTLRMSSDLERSGDLARHVAKLARLRYPAQTLPEELVPIFTQMCQTGRRMVERAGEVIADKDVNGAAELMAADDEMDRLHRQVFSRLLDPSKPLPAQVTVDATLLSRYYERYADHAVSVALRVIYLVTGLWHDDPLPGTYDHGYGPTPRDSV